jgi:hypothetical protein
MAGTKPRILVVEDEPLIAIDLAAFLVDMESECVGPIVDLSAALHHAGTNALDAAILNLIINGQHAYGVAEILETRNIPLGFASGVPHADIDGRWHDRPYLDKPYGPDEILDFVVRIIADGHGRKKAC